MNAFTPDNLVEGLFYAPAAMDLLLLVITYSYCLTGGWQWYLETMEKDSAAAAVKKDDDDESERSRPISPLTARRFSILWELTIIAYTAYGCLYVFAFYWAVRNHEFRGPFCVCMTVLMFAKLITLTLHDRTKMSVSKIVSLLGFNLPTYGGYAAFYMWNR